MKIRGKQVWIGVVTILALIVGVTIHHWLAHEARDSEDRIASETPPPVAGSEARPIMEESLSTSHNLDKVADERAGAPQMEVRDESFLKALRASSIEDAWKRVEKLSVEELLQTARYCIAAGDDTILHEVVGRELLRRAQNEKDWGDMLSALADDREVPALRKLILEVFDACKRNLSDEQQRAVYDQSLRLAFASPDISIALQAYALNSANNILAERFRRGVVLRDTVDDYCHRLNTIMSNANRHPEMRRYAIKGLGMFEYRAAIPSLLRVLSEDENPENASVIRNACIILSDLQCVDAVQSIEAIMRTTKDPAVFASAAYSIGRLGTDDGIAALVSTAPRFNDGSCAIALQMQKERILKLLDNPEADHLIAAIDATQYMGKAKDVEICKQKLLALLPQLDDDRVIASVLNRVDAVASRTECAAIVDSLAKRPGFAKEWDKVYRHSRASTLTPDETTLRVAEEENRP